MYPTATTYCLALFLAGSSLLSAFADAFPEARSTILDDAPPKVIRYATRLIARYDTDKSGELNSEEWSTMRGRPLVLDRDGNGTATLAEIVLHIRDYGRSRRLGEAGAVTPNPQGGLGADNIHKNGSPTRSGNGINGKSNIANGETHAGESFDAPFHVPTNLRSNNLPGWFTQRDRNGDGQLSLAEYAPTGSRDAVRSFERLDANRDGLITPAECRQPKTTPTNKTTPSQGSPPGEPG